MRNTTRIEGPVPFSDRPSAEFYHGPFSACSPEPARPCRGQLPRASGNARQGPGNDRRAAPCHRPRRASRNLRAPVAKPGTPGRLRRAFLALVRPEAGLVRGVHEHTQGQDHLLDRPLGVRQVHPAALGESPERPDRRRSRQGRHVAERRPDLWVLGGCNRIAQKDGHGLSETQPVPHEHF